MDRRLQNRYVKLVQAHMHNASSTAAGPTAAVASTTALAATQAAWRFLNNERVTLAALAAPLQEAGRETARADTAPVALVVHDWSRLNYGEHVSKQDRARFTHDHDIGYELATNLLVSASDGSPLAPMQMQLTTGNGVHSTATAKHDGAADLSHIDQVLAAMNASWSWNIGKPLVHIIDREADSVDHYRQWDADGHLFLVRGDDRCVLYEGRECRLSQVAQRLLAGDSITDGGTVRYRDRPAQQQVAQSVVTLHRPGKKRVNGRREAVPGRPLELRLVVSRIRDATGKTLATWLLLTNVRQEGADAATIARWYYWRWRIESFFKLLKSHNQQIEQWQQETGAAILRRLLVATMACVTVWDLQRQRGTDAMRMKDLLVRLSGRQMKRTKPHTDPALLAGLFVLLPMLALLHEHGGNLQHLESLARKTLPFFNTA